MRMCLLCVRVPVRALLLFLMLEISFANQKYKNNNNMVQNVSFNVRIITCGTPFLHSFSLLCSRYVMCVQCACCLAINTHLHLPQKYYFLIFIFRSPLSRPFLSFRISHWNLPLLYIQSYCYFCEKKESTHYKLRYAVWRSNQNMQKISNMRHKYPLDHNSFLCPCPTIHTAWEYQPSPNFFIIVIK